MLPFVHIQFFLRYFVFTNQQELIPTDCRVKSSGTITCEESIPGEIPPGISSVFVSNYLRSNISSITFAHFSWRHVKVFDININTIVDFTIAGFNFHNLNNVEVIGIHSRRLEIIHIDMLSGLNSLHTLDFSKCTSLSIKNLVEALLTYPRSLKFLKLDQVGGRSVTIDGNFVNMVVVKKISKLSLSGNNIFLMGPVKDTVIEPSLKFLDISNSTILPSFAYSYNDRYIMLTTILRNIEVMNVSSMPYSFLDLDFTVIQKINGRDCLKLFNESNFRDIGIYFLPKLKILEMNNLFKYKVVLNNSVINLTCIGQVNLKSISLRRNNLQWANISVLLPSDSDIKEIDLSSNKLQYLSPKLMSEFLHLEILNLANNSLSIMQSNREFSSIFEMQRNLIILNMAFNSLTNLPFNIFSNNHKLRQLDLHGNKLKTISFMFQHLHNLLILNLGFNNIDSLDLITVKELKSFRKIIGRAKNETASVEIVLHGNPFVCNCKTAEFIEWIFTDLTMYHNQSYSCYHDGQFVTIDRGVIAKSKFLCYRTLVITLSVLGIAIAATILSVMVIIAHHRRKAKTRKLSRDRFIEMFLTGKFHKKRISFIAYASDDLDELNKSFCRSLDTCLQDCFKTDWRLISTGDIDIAPGYPIIEEILRCVNDACTLIAIASRKFCESEWCQIELREAYKLNIPIILLFKEDVEERLMSPTMLAVFKRFTRAKLIVKNETFETVPEWNKFVESVINLASECTCLI